MLLDLQYNPGHWDKVDLNSTNRVFRHWDKVDLNSTNPVFRHWDKVDLNSTNPVFRHWKYKCVMPWI